MSEEYRTWPVDPQGDTSKRPPASVSLNDASFEDMANELAFRSGTDRDKATILCFLNGDNLIARCTGTDPALADIHFQLLLKYASPIRIVANLLKLINQENGPSGD